MTRRSILFLIAVPACTGTDIGNPVVDIDVDVHGEIPPEPTLRARPGVGQTSVSEAWVSVERIRLRDAATCEGDTELELLGPFAIDARAVGAIPELRGIEVAAQEYCRFELRWRPYDGPSGGVPAELGGASFLIKGARADGSPFVLRSERGDELRLDARDVAGFTIDDVTGALFVGFDLAQLFDGVVLNDGVADPDGVVRIDRDTNRDLLDAFDDNVADVAKLFDDNDDDGELDPEERDDTDVLAD